MGRKRVVVGVDFEIILKQLTEDDDLALRVSLRKSQ